MVFERLRKREIQVRDKEEHVLGMVRVYINEIIGVVEKLTPLINAFCAENATTTQREFQHLLKLEKEADGTRKGILLELSRGGNYPVNKEDLLQLIKSLAALGTIAAGIGCRVVMRSYSLPTQMREHLLEMLANDLELIYKLRETLMAMRPSMRRAIEFSTEVEMLERKSDGIYRVLYSDLMNIDIDFKSFSQLRDIIIGLENLADSAKECAEIVRLIAVKYV
ncbi:MAG: DUF47 family protein [Halobacteria archaeon]